MKLKFSRQIVVNFEISNLCKSVHWKPSFPCGWTDRQTDTKKLIVTFRNFANALKNGINSIIIARVNLLREVIFHELLIVQYRPF